MIPCETVAIDPATAIARCREAVIHAFEVGEYQTALDVCESLFALGDAVDAIVAIAAVCWIELGDERKASLLYARLDPRSDAARIASRWIRSRRRRLR